MAELHSRLEPFLLLARTTKGAAAAKVVLDATAAVSAWRESALILTSPERRLCLLGAAGAA